MTKYFHIHRYLGKTRQNDRSMAREKIIKYLSLSVCVFLLVNFVRADDASDYYKVPAYRIGNVSKIFITKASERTDYNPDEKCDTFVMTPKLVKFFIGHAKVTSEDYFFHGSDYSACKSEGDILFSNGDEGGWTILRNGVGLLYLHKGKYAGKIIYLHCTRCEEWNL